MRLADSISQSAAACDPLEKETGFCASIAAAINEAQRFDLCRDVLLASDNARRTRPSTMVEAREYIRLPYPKIWVEWLAALYPYQTDSAEKPIPERIGFLAEEFGEHLIGVTFGWRHKPPHGLQMCPLGLMINRKWDRAALLKVVTDFEKNPSRLEAVNEKLCLVDTDGNKGDLATRLQKWKRTIFVGREEEFERLIKSEMKSQFRMDDREVQAVKDLEAMIQVVESPHGINLIDLLVKRAPEIMKKCINQWTQDIQTEAMSVIGFILLLNCRNALDLAEKEDFRRLNKARGPHKPPKHEFIVTRLRLRKSVGNGKGTASESERAQARAHLVRGHFKTRKTGVFWWSPYLWGKARPNVERSHYKVAC